MSHDHPHPAHRMLDHAAQIRLIVKDLRHHGVSPEAIRNLQGIARELGQCARAWEEVYGPGKLPVAKPPLLPYMPKRGLQVRAEDEPPILRQFWQTYEALSASMGNGIPEPLNHSSDPEHIAINLPHLYGMWRNSELPILEMSGLKAALRRSVRVPLVAKNHLMRSRLLGKATRCWVFEKP